MENPDSDDVFIVCFMQRVDFKEETYLTNTKEVLLC